MRIFKRNPASEDAAKETKKGKKENVGKGKGGKTAAKGKDKDRGAKKSRDGKKASSKDSETASTASMDSGFNSVDSKMALEGAMKDNLDLMLEIIMRIREDEDYAKNIYADCPRLQHLLDKNPDLRPIFEDPSLVRINFEHVYRKCGGVLPEDKKPWYIRFLAVIVNHPLFKVFRFLLFVKKIYSCIVNGGFLVIRNLFMSVFCLNGGPSVEDLAADAADAAGNPDNLAAKEALWRAAEHMEQPEVRDQMDVLLQGDPEDLDEMIENDADLKGLRESSPLCAELMSDPTTLRILVDPDNLRALGDCADLVEQDFADPHWTAPDVESIPYDDPAYAEVELANAVLDTDVPEESPTNPLGDADVAVEGDDGEGEGVGEAELLAAPETGIVEDFERGENAAVNKKAQQQQQKEEAGNDKEGGGGAIGFLSTLGTGLVDYVAQQTVGMTATEMMGGGGGDGDFALDELDDLGELDDQAEEAADSAAGQAVGAANEAASNAAQVTSVVTAASELADDDEMIETLEGAMDEVEEAHEEHEDEQDDEASVYDDVANAAGTVATVGVVGSGVMGAGAMGAGLFMPGEGKKDKALATEGPVVVKTVEDATEEEAEKEVKRPNSRFRSLGKAIGNGLSAFGAATKEFAVTTVLGDALGEEVIERLEDRKKDKDKDSDDSANSFDDDDDNDKRSQNGEDDKENDKEVRDKSHSSSFGNFSLSGSGFFGKRH